MAENLVRVRAFPLFHPFFHHETYILYHFFIWQTSLLPMNTCQASPCIIDRGQNGDTAIELAYSTPIGRLGQGVHLERVVALNGPWMYRCRMVRSACAIEPSRAY